ncbi:MAG: putative bifunctional diguanylate cyclase/phosphodiesterase [Sphingomonadaceae bacterium]
MISVFRLSRQRWLTIVCAALFGITFLASLWFGQRVNQANAARQRALLEQVKLQAEAMLLLERDAAQGRLSEPVLQQRQSAVQTALQTFQQRNDPDHSADVARAQHWADAMQVALIGSAAALLLSLLGLVRRLRAALGGSVQDLHRHIVILGQGDFVTPVPVPPGQSRSVMGWLAETRAKLAQLDADRTLAETSATRLNNLYAALSHCNQIIVHCKSERDLFARICENIVIRGGMQMAWIGLLDDGGRLQPSASYGDSQNYLQTLELPGDSPGAIALRDDYAVWSQDLQREPVTQPSLADAVRYGWHAAGALPLHRGGQVIGMLAIYAGVRYAFAPDVRTLLQEMANDIDYALKSLDHERQRERASLALLESERHLRTIIETEPEGIIVLARSGRVLDMNPAGLAMLDAETLADLQQRDLLTTVPPPYHDEFRVLHQRAIDGKAGMLEFEMQTLRGAQRWFEIHAAPLRASDGAPTMLGIVRNITQRKQSEERILQLAHTDYLTGLPNRVRLGQLATATFAQVQQRRGKAALMFLDHACFKDINDALGHGIGDTLLVQLAQRLNQYIGPQDCVARLGGDEFVLLFGDADCRRAAALARQLLDVVGATFRIEQYELTLSASIGIVLFPDDGAELGTLFQRADVAMYAAKHDGRNRFRFFSGEMQAHLTRQLELVSALRQAVSANQLQLHYQPQINLAAQTLTGAEALLRWNHPQLGSVAPAEFIPAAEASGLILPLGEWVLRHAVRQAAQWQRDGMAPLRIAVNLSAVQFRQPDLPELVSRILFEEGLAPEWLELELTEGATMDDPQRAVEMMDKLHARGIGMSIDDFGTGYSSLSKLKKFRINKLKIDQSFVRDICSDPEDQAIVAAIISMAGSLGLNTIAEGVETAEQQAMLRTQGCVEIQGYFYSRPLPPEQFAAYAARYQ